MSIPAARIPRHIAIIMDGNGRWANARGLPRAMGHRKGVEAVREATEEEIGRGTAGTGFFRIQPQAPGSSLLH